MSTKKKQASKPRNSLIVERSSDDSEDAITAKMIIRPDIQAALTVQTWHSQADTTALAVALSAQIDELNKGNMSRPEAMLLMQAHTLDGIFNSLARKAYIQDHMKNYDAFLRLALKAQSQCRSTLEALAAIKNPPVIYAKQANISNGHQQINNGTPAPATHAGENQIKQNELLEHTHGERLDIRTKSEAIGINTELEALEKGHGCTNDRG
jgi:hypothetical protein